MLSTNREKRGTRAIPWEECTNKGRMRLYLLGGDLCYDRVAVENDPGRMKYERSKPSGECMGMPQTRSSQLWWSVSVVCTLAMHGCIGGLPPCHNVRQRAGDVSLGRGSVFCCDVLSDTAFGTRDTRLCGGGARGSAISREIGGKVVKNIFTSAAFCDILLYVVCVCMTP